MNQSELRSLWLAIIALAAIVGGISAGAGLHALDAEPATAAGGGGATFLAIASLGFAVVRHFRD